MISLDTTKSGLKIGACLMDMITRIKRKKLIMVMKIKELAILSLLCTITKKYVIPHSVDINP